MNKSYFLSNKYNHLSIINKTHKKNQKLKYADHLNKNSVGYIKLDYKANYNWLNETIRIIEFDSWNILVGAKSKTLLALSCYRIKKIPIEICQLTNLQDLYILGNHINDIPKKIRRLVNLNELWLCDKQIKKIPKEVCQLVNLSILWLNNNQIKKIPKELCQLINLKTLCLSDNEIKKIPKELCHLANLKFLSLHNNKISEIPDEFFQFTKLHKIVFIY